jgi:putative spermidine/putrescine transport system substrate-binding protein
MAVIKGNPGGKDEAAMKFIASAQDPAKQLVMFNMLAQGPANPAPMRCCRPRRRAQPGRSGELRQADAAEHGLVRRANYGPALDAYLAIISA